MGAHDAPPSTLTKTPSSRVPANTVPGITGSTATAATLSGGRPLLAAAQVAPPSVVLKTPEFSIAAYTVSGAPGSIASDRIARFWIVGSPVLIGTHMPPAFVVLNIPDE